MTFTARVAIIFSVKEKSCLRKYLVAAVLVRALTAPAFAVERFYLADDGRRCEVLSHKPPAGMKVLGTFIAARRPKGDGQEGSMQERVIGPLSQMNPRVS